MSNSPQANQDWLAGLLAGVKNVQSNGAPLPVRAAINLIGSVSCEDNPTNDSTDITIGSGLGQYTETLSAGLNSNVSNNGLASLRVTSSGAFSIGGIALPGGAAPIGGQRQSIINTSIYPMSIINGDASSTAQYRLQVGSGSKYTFLAGKATAVFEYDATLSLWVLQNDGIKYPRKYDIRDFGAKVDGATDDLLAVRAAVAAAAMIGGVVYFPAGQCNLSDTVAVPTNVSIEGDHFLGSVLMFTGATNGLTFTGNVSTYSIGAARVSDVKIASTGTGLCGLTVQNTYSQRIERVFVTGWTHQGVSFVDTLLTEFNNSTVTLSGGATYGAVEVDSANVNGSNAGPGSTTFYMTNVNITNCPSAIAGLRVDRTSLFVMRGGSAEGCQIPVQVSAKSESTTPCQCVIIEEADLEIAATNADHYIEFGYGLTGSAATVGLVAPRVLRCTMSGTTKNIPYGLKFTNTKGAFVDGCHIEQNAGSGPALVASILFDSTGNTFMSIGGNRLDLSVPKYVSINGFAPALPNDASGTVGPWAYQLGALILSGLITTGFTGGTTGPAVFAASSFGASGLPSTLAQAGWLTLYDDTGAAFWVPFWK